MNKLSYARRGLRALLTVGAAVGVSTVTVAIPAFADNTGTNSVAHWCGDAGQKFEPVSDPFVVPDVAPADHHLTLLVLKAGSGADENHTFPNPVVGQGYSHPSHHANSHAILCWAPDEVPETTEPEPETTEPEPETTEPEPETTEPEPETTEPNPAVTTTTLVGGAIGTTTTVVGGASGTTTTVVGGAIGTTTTPPAPTLPATGSSSTPVVLTAAGLLLAGTAVLIANRRRATI